MANSASFQVVGLDKLRKKLDAGVITPAVGRIVFTDLGDLGSATLRGYLSTQFTNTASSVRLTRTDVNARITAERFPYVFFERGSQYPTTGPYAASGATPRSHRTRRGVKASALRIKARRFLSKTRSTIRRATPGVLAKAAQQIEKDWAA